jgi:hypothetical protein
VPLCITAFLSLLLFVKPQLLLELASLALGGGK